MAAPDGLSGSTTSDWPDLPLTEWADTCATLHLWTQVVGKIRLAHAPMINHWWQVPLYVTCRGLTTSPIPYGARRFQIDFDFIDHRLRIQTGEGNVETIPLGPRTVADFYHRGHGPAARSRTGDRTSGRCRSKSKAPHRSIRTRASLL